MNKNQLDAVLVPPGVLMLVLYHLWFLRRFFRQPTKTVMGINAINRRLWVDSMMEDPGKTGVLAVQTLRNNIMASTLLASMSIMLGSLIAILMSNGWGSTTVEVKDHEGMVYGNRGEQLLSLKFFCIMTCFLLAFLFNVQSIRYYSHVSVLINVPVNKQSPTSSHALTAGYVTKALDRGSFFWTMGLRAFYFSLPLFVWLFGPIPMLACCFLMLLLLYFFDASFEWKPQDAAGRS